MKILSFYDFSLKEQRIHFNPSGVFVYYWNFYNNLNRMVMDDLNIYS